MNGRFDYVKYDAESQQTQALAKRDVQFVEQVIEKYIKCEVSRANALRSLEECYMWIGKGIRNDQVARTGSVELQEERTDS